MDACAELQRVIADKNNFFRLCRDMDIPTLETHVFQSPGQFDTAVRPYLDSTRSYIMKAAGDRVTLEDKRRRFFRFHGTGPSAQELDAQCARIAGEDAEGFQVQRYLDFRAAPVTYYNTAFRLGDRIDEHLTTVQIVNFAAIEGNIPSTHWGNMSELPTAMLEPGKSLARKLAQHYFDIGYRGEIGIDFGICGDEIYFLETNARLNNSTKLFYFLLALGIDPKRSSYLYLSNFVVEFMHYKLLRHRKNPNIQFEALPDAKTLIVSDDPRVMHEIYQLILEIVASRTPYPG